MVYEFKHKDMLFSTDGSFDEVLALDRYVVSEYENFSEGDTVVFPSAYDEDYNAKQVGVLTEVDGVTAKALDRKGRTHEIELEVTSKALETEPHQLWSRWSKGASSVEKTDKQKEVENDFRWLFDGFRFSPGGRIQISLGQEHVTGERAPLTAYNCFVIPSPEAREGDLDQFLEVLAKAELEASIMRRGGGVGLNIGNINTVNGIGKDIDFGVTLRKDHRDHDEYLERIEKGKFKGVKTEHINKRKSSKNHLVIVPHDSVDGLFASLNDLVKEAYTGEWDSIVLNFSDLRHRNALVKGINGQSSGSVSWAELYVLVINLLKQDKIDNVDFAEIYSTITNLIEQGGSRRGALMIVNNIENETIDKFISRKKTPGYLEGANISTGISDGFMQNIKANKADSSLYQIEASRWKNIIESAWSSAEPGIVWLERYNKESNSWYFNDIEATNPCGTPNP